MPRKRQNRQEELPLPERVPKGRGGWRPGAGRPRTQGRRSVDHSRRPFLERNTPVHVTLRIRAEVGRMRRRVGYRAVQAALVTSVRRVARFRVVHVSIQRTHIHLVCEAKNRRELACGVQGFSISCARQLNGRLGRSGRVFADRYHARAMKTPREVRNGLCYVLNNWRHHGEHRDSPGATFDPYSSARAFDGWAIAWRRRICEGDDLLPTALARSWLLTSGWRRHRLISPTEISPTEFSPAQSALQEQ